jgi:hypothetical protein
MNYYSSRPQSADFIRSNDSFHGLAGLKTEYSHYLSEVYRFYFN